MEIDSKFNPIGPTPGPGDIEPAESQRVEPSSTRFSEAPAESEAPGLAAVPSDPLQTKLSEIVRAADLHDPAATTATERRVLQEILQSTFGDAFLQGLELNDVLGTFQDFIHNDPALKEIMDRFIKDLAGPPRA